MDCLNVKPQEKEDASVLYVMRSTPTPQEQDEFLSTTSLKAPTSKKKDVPRLKLDNLSSAEQGAKEEQATGPRKEDNAASCQAQDEDDSEVKRKEPHYY